MIKHNNSKQTKAIAEENKNPEKKQERASHIQEGNST